MKEYASVKETWKTIFPEIMGSAGSIHIPMSRGLFRPEIHEDPPVPSELSVADLCALALLNRWFASGVRHADVQPELMVVHEDFPEVKIHWASLMTATTNFKLWFNLTNWPNEKLLQLMPRGPKGQYRLGDDRIIQRYLELNDFRVICILRPIVVPGLEPRIGYDARIMGTGSVQNIMDLIAPRLPPEEQMKFWDHDAPPAPEPDPGDFWLGATIIQLDLIHRHVIKRMRELG